MKEEIERLNKENKLLQDMDKILRNENTNLKLRISKALEYIEDYLCSYDYTSAELKEISDIFVRLMTTLRGEDNE